MNSETPIKSKPIHIEKQVYSILNKLINCNLILKWRTFKFEFLHVMEQEKCEKASMQTHRAKGASSKPLKKDKQRMQHHRGHDYWKVQAISQQVQYSLNYSNTLTKVSTSTYSFIKT